MKRFPCKTTHSALESAPDFSQLKSMGSLCPFLLLSTILISISNSSDFVT